ncbi:MAG TPA: branched-chain amino acid ABC transporter permease [Steroidobacteraceae bacterium]|nr:branched-chain amino acid ABC transporter permease [Steroidobacteraceae bacterium]
MRGSVAVYVLLGIAALAAPNLGVYPVFMAQLLCFAMFACAFNLLLGYTKMLSFGHAAYFGSSAYITGWLVSVHGWGTLAGILAGVAVAMLLGTVIGAIAVRRQGIYFAMITLALSQLVFFICLQADFTGGENGLQGIPRGSIAGIIPLDRDAAMYYFVLAMFVAVYFLVRRIVRSPFGHVLEAIRENEPRAISLGYKVDRYKLLAFVLSASIAGLAGSLKALTLSFVTLTDVSQGTSGDVILMTLLGGSGTFLGPVVGAGVVLTLQQYLSERVGAWVSVIIGAIFVVCVMIFRRGIVGEIQRRFARRPLA